MKIALMIAATLLVPAGDLNIGEPVPDVALGMDSLAALTKEGKVVAITPRSDAPVEIASGAPLIVDVEFGPDHRLYALSQGIWTLPPLPSNAGAPASANTGSLTRVDRHGRLTPVAGPLDRPTSVAFSRSSASLIFESGISLTFSQRRLPA